MPRRERRHAFTLVELLVVISIIALLISILLPALKAARTTAQLAASLSNLRQIAIAHHVYAQDNDQNLIFQSFDEPGGSPSHQLPTWAGVLVRSGYITDRGVYWSPGRDTSELNLDGGFRQPEPWWYTGYGTNTWASPTQRNYEAKAQPLTNLAHRDVPPHSDFLLMAEQSTDQVGIKMPATMPGFYRSQAAFAGTPATWGYNLFTYNGAAAHAYLDGHASSDSASIGWIPTDQFYGTWTYTRDRELKDSPWRKHWWQ